LTHRDIRRRIFCYWAFANLNRRRGGGAVVQIGVLTMMGILCASDDDFCDVDGSHSVLTNPFTSLLIIDHNHQRAASFICIHYYVDVHPPWSIISQASGKLLFRHSNRQKTAASSRNSISTIQFIIFNNSIKNS
jgi:hypothetical protein